jgi:enoyl-CoA hydratase
MSHGVFQIKRDRNIGVVDLRDSLWDQETLFETTNELDYILGEIESDSRIHVVILKGIESVNSNEPCGFIDNRALGNVPSASLTRCVGGMNRPVIAELDGRIVGLGMELALACDLRVAGEESSFCLPDVHSELMPWNGGTQTLPRLVGTAKAMELILMGEPIHAQESLTAIALTKPC